MSSRANAKGSTGIHFLLLLSFLSPSAVEIQRLARMATICTAAYVCGNLKGGGFTHGDVKPLSEFDQEKKNKTREGEEWPTE